MKHINLIHSTLMNDAANAVTRVVPSGKAVLAPFAALLITAFALAAGGCSKSKNNSQSANQSAPQSVSNQNLAETAAPTPLPAGVNQTETGKKKSVKGPVKTLASVRTFKDKDAGVSFIYPRKATLKAGDKAEQDSSVQERLPMSYIAPGGSILAAVELPASKKDQLGDLFLMNVNGELTADQCSQFPSDPQITSENGSSEQPANQAAVFTSGLKANFRGVEYSELDKQTDKGLIRYYHRFVPGVSGDKGTCYEFSMLVNAEPKQNGDDTASVEQKDVFTKLEKILASVKIESNKESEVVEAKTDSSTETESSLKANDSTAETAKAIVKDANPR